MSDSPGAAHSSKLEEQAKAKGDISYSYWASTDKPANNPEIAPKKLSEEEAAKLQQAAAQQGTNVSAWNAAGTFEERAVTDWAKQQLQQMLVGTSNNKAVITSCSVTSGDAHIWFIRGKKRHGFELDIELQWSLSSGSGSSSEAAAAGGADAAAGSSGSIKLPGVSPDELDDLSHMEVMLTQASGDAAADSAALAAAKGLKGPLEKALAAFYAELKTK